MRILFVPYPGSWGHEGGHRTQQGEMARALEQLGAEATVGTVEDAHAGRFDVVHAFNDLRPLLAHGRPPGRIAFSPVYWPLSVVFGPIHRRPGATGRTVTRVRHAFSPIVHRADWHARRSDAQAALAAIGDADLLVTYSHAEAALVAHDSKRPLPPKHVAYSGVGERFFEGDAAAGRSLLGLGAEPFVLCVARPEPIKNQLVLAEAMRDRPERLVLVGEVLPGNERYLDDCRRLCPGLVHVPHLDHDDLRHVYAAATVTVLPSWFEVSGLALLESLAAGTAIVAARNPCLEEYYGGIARFHAPSDVAGLRNAIAETIPAPLCAGEDARAHARRFSWRASAEQLLGAYSS